MGNSHGFLSLIKKRRKRPIATLELTPLIDVVFLLLIFFMTTTTFINFQQSIRLDLPDASGAKSGKDKNIIITIAADSQFYLMDEPVNPTELLEKLNNQLEKSKDKLVIIRADKTVAHQFVVTAMDIAGKAGAQQLAVATTERK